MHKVYNCIVVINPTKTSALFCKRQKDPYKGQLNFVGGKVEPGEDPDQAAYRELQEETGITRKQIRIFRLMDIRYYDKDFDLELYVGKLEEDILLKAETNPLLWLSLDEDFTDRERFAGEQNIAHIMNVALQYPIPERSMMQDGLYIGVDGCRNGWVAAVQTHLPALNCQCQKEEIDMEFTELIKRRRSVRGYEDTLVSHEDLVEILTQAQQAPSWKNSQTARCYVAETPEKLEEIRKSGLPAFNQNSSANAALIVTTFVKDTAGFSNGKPDNEGGNYWGAYDLGLHDAYLVLAASNAGYDTLIMGIRDAEILRKDLEIPENEQIMSVIAIGKRAKEPMDKARKDLGEVVRFF